MTVAFYFVAFYFVDFYFVVFYFVAFYFVVFYFVAFYFDNFLLTSWNSECNGKKFTYNSFIDQLFAHILKFKKL